MVVVYLNMAILCRTLHSQFGRNYKTVIYGSITFCGLGPLWSCKLNIKIVIYHSGGVTTDVRVDYFSKNTRQDLWTILGNLPDLKSIPLEVGSHPSICGKRIWCLVSTIQEVVREHIFCLQCKNKIVKNDFKRSISKWQQLARSTKIWLHF